MTSYRQHIDVAYGLSGRQRQNKHLDTPTRSLKAVT